MCVCTSDKVVWCSHEVVAQIVCWVCVVRNSADPVCITSSVFDGDIRFYRISSPNPAWTVGLPDGSSVLVQLRRWGTVVMLDVTVTVSMVRFGGLGGLCGTNDGVKANDLGGIYGNCTEGMSIRCWAATHHIISCVLIRYTRQRI